MARTREIKKRIGAVRTIQRITKTMQMIATAKFTTAVQRAHASRPYTEKVQGLVEEALSLDSEIRDAAQRYRYMDHCVVLGRGFNYATAYEWSLKLKEMTYVVAEPYSSADFRHGPVAIVCDGFPVLAVVPGGAVFDESRVGVLTFTLRGPLRASEGLWPMPHKGPRQSTDCIGHASRRNPGTVVARFTRKGPSRREPGPEPRGARHEPSRREVP